MKSEAFDVRELALFQGLSAGEVQRLRPMLKRSSVPAGVTVIRKGEPCRHVCVLVRGSVKVCVVEGQTPVVMLAMLGVGEVLGEVSAVDGLPHSADVITLERSLFVTMSSDDFCCCLETMPRFARNLSVLLTRRLRDATTHLHSVASQDVAGRVARQLVAFARRYAEPSLNPLLSDAFDDIGHAELVNSRQTGMAKKDIKRYERERGDIEIPIRITQSDLGELVGASRVRVNEVVVAFKRQGFISVDGNCRMIIHDLPALLLACGDELAASQRRASADAFGREVVCAESAPSNANHKLKQN